MKGWGRTVKGFIGKICQRAAIFFMIFALDVTGCFPAPMPVKAAESAAGAAELDNAGEQDDAAEPDNSGESGETDGTEHTAAPGKPGTPDVAMALTHIDRQGVLYTLTGASCYVAGFEKTVESTVKIPSQIEDGGKTYEVKGLEEAAFISCTALKKIEIPNNLSVAAEVFQGCTKLKSIHILPVESTVKKSKKTSVVTIKINGALLTTSADEELEIAEDTIREAAFDEKTEEVTLQVYIEDNSNYMVGDALPVQIILQEKAARTLADSGKSFQLKVRDAGGGNYYVKVSAKDMKLVAGDLRLAVQKKALRETTGALKEDLTKAFRKNGVSSGKAQILSYTFGSDSRTNVSLVLPAEGTGAAPGSKVYVYRYDKGRHIFAAVSFHSYTVSKNGNITLPISKGGTFVVTKKAFRKMSRQPASEFLTEAGAVYYIDKNGREMHGWRKIVGDYYYFDRENGKMAAGKKVDSVQLLADGRAKQTSSAVARIQTMMKARAVVERLIKPTDTDSQKIEKCFRWVFPFPYRRYRRLQPIYKQAGWEVTFANDIFDRKQGCCVSDSCAVAFLLHECGFKDVYVGIDTGHAWVELNGRVYDPLFAEARGFNKYYNIPYSSYYMSRPVLKRKI